MPKKAKDQKIPAITLVHYRHPDSKHDFRITSTKKAQEEAEKLANDGCTEVVYFDYHTRTEIQVLPIEKPPLEPTD